MIFFITSGPGKIGNFSVVVSSLLLHLVWEFFLLYLVLPYSSLYSFYCSAFMCDGCVFDYLCFVTLRAVRWSVILAIPEYIIWAASRQNLSSGFPTKRDSNQSHQLQRLARN